MLSLLKKEAAQEGRNLQTLLAFDPNANPDLSGVIETAARLLGIETTFLPEVAFQDYRHAIDHNKAFCQVPNFSTSYKERLSGWNWVANRQGGSPFRASWGRTRLYICSHRSVMVRTSSSE